MQAEREQAALPHHDVTRGDTSRTKRCLTHDSSTEFDFTCTQCPATRIIHDGRKRCLSFMRSAAQLEIVPNISNQDVDSFNA